MRFPSRLSLALVAALLLGATAMCASGVANAPPAAARPAQKLTPYIFPDGSGSMGLPVIDPTSPQAGVLMAGGGAPASFIAVPYSADAATLFTQGSAQIAQKMRRQAPAITIKSTRNLPLESGKNFMVYGQVDAHDGRGAQAIVAQMIVTLPQALGAYQVTVFEITAPPQVMVNDAATIAEIYPNYNRNTQFVMVVANAQMQQSQIEQQQFLDDIAQRMDSSDKLTAGMSNLLRGQTVIRNTQTGEHVTVSDQRADWLTRHNPYLFEVVPESDYISGIDY